MALVSPLDAEWESTNFPPNTNTRNLARLLREEAPHVLTDQPTLHPRVPALAFLNELRVGISNAPDEMGRVAPMNLPSDAEKILKWAQLAERSADIVQEKLRRLLRTAGRVATATFFVKQVGGVAAVLAAVATAALVLQGSQSEPMVKFVAAVLSAIVALVTVSTDLLGRIFTGFWMSSAQKLTDMQVDLGTVLQRLHRPEPPLTETDVKSLFDKLDAISSQLNTYRKA